jgi:hypothetical protein
MAEAEGFEPSRGYKAPTRLAGGRTRPLCDASSVFLRTIAAINRNHFGQTEEGYSKAQSGCGSTSVDGDLSLVASRLAVNRQFDGVSSRSLR